MTTRGCVSSLNPSWLQQTGPATNKPSSKTANHLPKIDTGAFWGSTFQLVIFSDVCAALSLELDGSRQDICSSYPPGVLHKVDSLSSSHGPSGSTAGTIPSPNTIRKRDLFIQPFKASDQREIMSGWVWVSFPRSCCAHLYLSFPPAGKKKKRKEKERKPMEWFKLSWCTMYIQTHKARGVNTQVGQQSMHRQALKEDIGGPLLCFWLMEEKPQSPYEMKTAFLTLLDHIPGHIVYIFNNIIFKNTTKYRFLYQNQPESN